MNREEFAASMRRRAATITIACISRTVLLRSCKGRGFQRASARSYWWHDVVSDLTRSILSARLAERHVRDDLRHEGCLIRFTKTHEVQSE